MTFARFMVMLSGALMLLATSCSTPHRKQTTPRAVEERRPLPDAVQFARPICGTGSFPAAEGANNTFPGAVMPFGMIQWSPDTGAGIKPGGYGYYDTQISGFSLDHLSGAGCPDGGDFSFMPILDAGQAPDGNRLAFATTFSHENEIARPGYYAVTMADGIKVELTTTTRTGFGRFTYPMGKTGTMAINAASDVNGSDDANITVDPAAHEVSGWSIGGYFCQSKERVRDRRTIYFCAIFNQPFSGYGTWSDDGLAHASTNENDTSSGAFLTFDTSKNQTVLVKVGISYVSIANARTNIEMENPTTHFSYSDFDTAADSAGETWNAWLNKIQVSGGPTNELQTFYSMLYHTLLAPTVCSDANGDYMGYDGKVHNAGSRAQYANFSGWDIYRSEAQLLAMLAPHEASDMAQSLLLDYQQGGAFPRWGAATEDSGVMVGDPVAAIIPDFYAFGATNFDVQSCLTGLVRAVTDPSVFAPRSKTYERDALDDYLKLGYVPQHQRGGYGNVSMTLEYDSADFALSQLATALGDDADSAMLLQHAQGWSKLYNRRTGYIEMRRRDGHWSPAFTNNAESYNGDQAFVEGTAEQYLWMVPFNLQGLADTIGGKDVAVRRLDKFFTRLDAGDRGPDAWMAWLGNEPCLGTPWIYDFLGEPYKTQAIVRRAINILYSDSPAAYPGNDDLG
jgi:predicted alpha-1,2-mannosidase